MNNVSPQTQKKYPIRYRHQMPTNRKRAGALPEKQDARLVDVENGRFVLHPVHRLDLILQAIVASRARLFEQLVQREKASDAESIVHCDVNMTFQVDHVCSVIQTIEIFVSCGF